MVSLAILTSGSSLDATRGDTGRISATSPPMTLTQQAAPSVPKPEIEGNATTCRAAVSRLECVSFFNSLHTMRTNIVIDDQLMQDTLRATGLRTKREAVELGLRTLLRLRQQEEIRHFRGKLNWQGDLEAMRADK